MIMPDQGTMMAVYNAVRQALGRGFRLGRRGGGAPMVDTGDFLVSITVNDETMSQTVRVERLSGGGGFGFGFDQTEW